MNICPPLKLSSRAQVTAERILPLMMPLLAEEGLSFDQCVSELAAAESYMFHWFLKRDGLCIEPPQKDRTTWIFLSVFVGFSWIFDLSFLSVALVVMGNLRWETQLSVAKKLMQRVTGTALFSHCTGCGTTWNDIWACLKIGFLSPIHGHFDQCMLLWGTLFWDESSWCMSKQDQQSPKHRMGWEDARAQSQHHFSERTAKGLLNSFQPEPRFLTLKEQVLGCIASRAVQYLKGLATLSSFEVNMVQQKKVAAKRGTSQHCNISQNCNVDMEKVDSPVDGMGYSGTLFSDTATYRPLFGLARLPSGASGWNGPKERVRDPQGSSGKGGSKRCPLRRKSGRFLLRKSCRVSCGSRMSTHPHLRSGQLLEWCLLIGCYALMYLLYSSHVILSKITFSLTKERIWSPRSILQFSYSWF